MVERIPPLESIGGRTPHLWLGGLRYLGDPSHISTQAFPSPITGGVESEHGWYFLLQDGTFWRADSFLGEAERVHRFARGSRLGHGNVPVLVVDGSGALYQIEGRLAQPLAGLDAHAVTDALGAGQVFAKDVRGVWFRHDAGTWTEVAAQSTPRPERYTVKDAERARHAMLARSFQIGYRDGFFYDGGQHLFSDGLVFGPDGVHEPASLDLVQQHWVTPDGLVANVNMEGQRMHRLVAQDGEFRPVDLAMLGEDGVLDAAAWADASSLLFVREGALCRYFFGSGRVEDLALDLPLYGGESFAYGNGRVYAATIAAGNNEVLHSVRTIDLDARRGSYIALPRPGVGTRLVALPDGFVLSVREGESEERSDHVYRWHAPNRRHRARLDERVLPGEGSVLVPSDGAFWLFVGESSVRTSMDEGARWSDAYPYRRHGTPSCDAHGCRVGDLVISMAGTFPSPLPFRTSAPEPEQEPQTRATPLRCSRMHRAQAPSEAHATLSAGELEVRGQVAGRVLSFRSPLDPSMAVRSGEAVAFRVEALSENVARVLMQRSNGWRQTFIVRAGQRPTRLDAYHRWMGTNASTITVLQQDGVRSFRADEVTHHRRADGIWVEGAHHYAMREFAGHRWATLEGAAHVAELDRAALTRFCDDADAAGARIVTTYTAGRAMGIRVQLSDPPCIDEVHNGDLVGRAFAGELSRGDLTCRFMSDTP